MYCFRSKFKRRSLLFLVLALFLLLTSVCWADVSESYRAGVAFGRDNSVAVAQNAGDLRRMGEARGVNLDFARASALERAAATEAILPDKIAWIKGVADGSGVSYEDLLVMNTMDRDVTGFTGECTTFIAHGSSLASGKGSLISKNRDLGANTICEVSMEEGRRNDSKAIYRAAYIDIPDVDKTYRFIGSRSAGRWGYGMGVNEKQVLVSDNDAPTRDALSFKKGLHDNDYIRLILERAGTAREGVEIVTKLTEKYGQAWNSIMFEIADPKELWIVEVSGYRWVAKKYDNTYTARSNQFQITDDYDLSAKDLISYAASMGWVAPDVKKINFRAVYGGTSLYPDDNDNIKDRASTEILYNTEIRYQRAMELLKSIEGKISPQAVLPFTRDHYDTYVLPSGKELELKQVPFYSSEYADMNEWIAEFPEKDNFERVLFPRAICHHAFGGITASAAVLVARPDVPDQLGLMLHCFMQPCNSLFVPFYVGISSVDKRFSTTEAGSNFMLISKMAFGSYESYHKSIRSVFDPYEASLFSDMSEMEASFIKLKKEGKDKDAQVLLDKFSDHRSSSAVDLSREALKAMFKDAAASSTWNRD